MSHAVIHIPKPGREEDRVNGEHGWTWCGRLTYHCFPYIESQRAELDIEMQTCRVCEGAAAKPERARAERIRISGELVSVADRGRAGQRGMSKAWVMLLLTASLLGFTALAILGVRERQAACVAKGWTYAYEVGCLAKGVVLP